MTKPRDPRETVTLIDNYSQFYKDIFPDVRALEHFRTLLLGILSELPRKSLPNIAKLSKTSDYQDLHHFFANSTWKTEDFRERRLELTKKVIGEMKSILLIDESGDKKFGNTIDYVARQYIGRIGKVDKGIVYINSYALVGNIVFPLTFRVFKPQSCLRKDDVFKTKPQLAAEMIEELLDLGFRFKVVVADSLYGESPDFVQALRRHGLKYAVSLRSNHGWWLPKGQKIKYTKWKKWQRVFSDGSKETRYICEIIPGRRSGRIRYYLITTDKHKLPPETTRMVETDLSVSKEEIGNIFGNRTWIEYGHRQVKDELGWNDYRFTEYRNIERWWEVILSAYLMISMQSIKIEREPKRRREKEVIWELGFCEKRGYVSWRDVLRGIRLLLQPAISFSLLGHWLGVFEIPELLEGFTKLLGFVNSFQCSFPI